MMMMKVQRKNVCMSIRIKANDRNQQQRQQKEMAASSSMMMIDVCCHCFRRNPQAENVKSRGDLES